MRHAAGVYRQRTALVKPRGSHSVAGLGAFVAPWLIGLLKDATGSYSYGLLMLAALVVAGGFLVLSIKHDIVLEHAPDERPLAA